MTDKPSPWLLSDPALLRRIKLAQFRAQIPSLLLLVAALALNYLFPRQNLYWPALGLALAAIAWYLFIGFSHRFSQRVARPPANALVSPIQGKIAYVRSSGDLLLVNLRKMVLDSVEIRSPHSACRFEDGALHLESPQGRISLRFNFDNLRWFDSPNLEAGNLIGMAVGGGSCTIALPQSLGFTLAPKAAVDICEVLLEEIFAAGEPAKPNILVESFGDYQPEN